MKTFAQLREELKAYTQHSLNEAPFHEEEDEPTRATSEFISVLPHVADLKARKAYVKQFHRISNTFFDHEHGGPEDVANAVTDLRELTHGMKSRLSIKNSGQTHLGKLMNHKDPLHRLMGDRFHGNIQSSAEDGDYTQLNKDIDDLHKYAGEHIIK